MHASYKDAVRESARLYFPRGSPRVLRIDPRRLPVKVEEAATPRGPMPHIHGAIPRDAVRGELTLDDVDAEPDAVRGAQIAVVAFEGMTLLDLVGVYDPLARIAGMGFDRESACTIVSATPGAWRGGGATLRVDAERPPLGAFDLLVVPGGPAARDLCLDRGIVDWLCTYPANRIVASVCTGALFLGAMGRLSGKRATTHQSALGLLEAYGAFAVRERVVDEGQLVTAGGVTSALDLGLHLVKRLYGVEIAAKIALQMEVRSSGDAKSMRPR